MRALGADPSSFEAQLQPGQRPSPAGDVRPGGSRHMQQAAADSLAAPVDRAQAFYNLGNTQFRQQKYRRSARKLQELAAPEPLTIRRPSSTTPMSRNCSTIRTSRIRTTRTTRTIKITRTIKTRTSRTARTSRIRRRARTIRRRVTGKATTSSRTAGPTRSRRARADPSRPAFRLPNRNGCSTPSRRRRTGRRRSSKRRPAPWYG